VPANGMKKINYFLAKVVNFPSNKRHNNTLVHTHIFSKNPSNKIAYAHKKKKRIAALLFHISPKKLFPEY
jgi:hypothetical protein